VVPADVVNAAADLHPILEVVLGAELEAVDGVGVESRRRLTDAESIEVGTAGCLRYRIIGAARAKTLGVREVVQIARIALVLQAHLRREGVFLDVAAVGL